MHQVTIHEAKMQLSKLIQEALRGETVVIAKGSKPLVKLVVLPEALPERRIGGAKQLQMEMPEDFNEPLSDFDDYKPVSSSSPKNAIFGDTLFSLCCVGRKHF